MTGRPPRDAAWCASAAVFVLNGAFVGSAVARVPAIKAQVSASSAFLGLALLALGVGSVTVMPFSSRITARFGSTWLTRLGVVATTCGWAGAAVSGTVVELAAALLVAGAGIGMWDVAMNIQGNGVERRDGRSWMPQFHAGVSAGMIVGAGWAALAARLGMGPASQFLVTAAIAGGGTILATRWYLSDKHQPARAPSAPVVNATSLWRSRPVLLIGLLVITGAVAEGAAGDWLAVTLVETRSATQSLAALAYSGFAGAMLIGRALGSAAIERWRRVAVLRCCGLTAAAGIVLLCVVPSIVVGLAGAVLWGLGVSTMFPAGMSAAGEAIPGRASDGIAVVSTLGYGGFLAGPPLIGLLAQSTRIDRALLLAVVCAVAVGVFAQVEREHPVHSGHAWQPLPR